MKSEPRGEGEDQCVHHWLACRGEGLQKPRSIDSRGLPQGRASELSPESPGGTGLGLAVWSSEFEPGFPVSWACDVRKVLEPRLTSPGAVSHRGSLGF